MSEEKKLSPEEIPEEQLTNRKPSEEIISDDESVTEAGQQPTGPSGQITNDKPETENMEVHHHPNIHHNPKRWKEYFLEFLMIFLAVTMGFFAENIREHISDNAKEKEYINGFIKDLQVDTATLSLVINENQIKITGIDSLLQMAHSNITTPTERKLFYNYCIYILSFDPFKSDDVTFMQLKNSGGFHLIRKNAVADSLIKYDQANTDIYGQEAVYRRAITYTEETLFDIIDMTVLNDTGFVKARIISDTELPAISGDPEKLKSFFNKAHFSRGVIFRYTESDLQNQLISATRLISFLKNTYHIENE